jgi:AcrR family transcriptional regulator
MSIPWHPGPPPTPRLARVDREQLILQAAERLFAERSFDGVGVDAIAREAGIVGSGVYRHFASKEEILAALIDQATDALLVSVGEPRPDPRDELRNLVESHVGFALTHDRLVYIWQREQHILTDDKQRSTVRRHRRYIDRWVTCLDTCYPGHSREELLATIRAMHALVTSDTTRPAGTRRPSDLAELLTKLAMAALDGLRQAQDTGAHSDAAAN